MTPLYIKAQLPELEMQPSENEEKKQVEESKTNPQKFEPLYIKYYEPILKFVYNRVEDLDDCRDVTATVFTKALANIHKFKDRGLPFKSWLYRIALNEVNQYYRDANRVKIISTEDKSVQSIKEETGMDKDILVSLKKALQYLSGDEVQLIELRFFEDRPFAEMGEILNISESNAKVRTYRTIEKLRAVFLKIS
jgi:RNA polymerase sigma-70 factor (ECF subfamily)